MLEPLDKFGKLVVEELRDRSIDYFDAASVGHWKAPALQQLQADLSTFAPEEHAIARRALIAALDAGIHGFLFALVEGHDRHREMTVIVDGQDVVAQSDGLHGELWARDGWIARFSKYPSNEWDSHSSDAR